MPRHHQPRRGSRRRCPIRFRPSPFRPGSSVQLPRQRGWPRRQCPTLLGRSRVLHVAPCGARAGAQKSGKEQHEDSTDRRVHRSAGNAGRRFARILPALACAVGQCSPRQAPSSVVAFSTSSGCAIGCAGIMSRNRLPRAKWSATCSAKSLNWLFPSGRAAALRSSGMLGMRRILGERCCRGRVPGAARAQSAPCPRASFRTRRGRWRRGTHRWSPRAKIRAPMAGAIWRRMAFSASDAMNGAGPHRATFSLSPKCSEMPERTPA